MMRILLRAAVFSGVLLGVFVFASPAHAKGDRSLADQFEPDSTADSEAEATAPEGELPYVPDAAPGDPVEEAKPARKAPRKRASRVRTARASSSSAARSSPPSDVTAAPREFYDLKPLASSPVPGVESSGFGWRADPINNRRKFHKGTDFRAPRGTPVYAAGAGRVIYAGRMGGYGNVIFIDHGDGVVSRYGHLRKIGVARDATVSDGVKIGEVGSTGRATGPHLHFEVRLDGRAVNPSVAMSVAALQRTNPTAAVAAAVALRPEVQATTVDPHPSAKRGKRPERRGRAKRSNALW
ncbi:MAG: M23 family metallopeptidase [Kofleriaceae bacterium]